MFVAIAALCCRLIPADQGDMQEERDRLEQENSKAAGYLEEIQQLWIVRENGITISKPVDERDQTLGHVPEKSTKLPDNKDEKS